MDIDQLLYHLYRIRQLSQLSLGYQEVPIRLEINFDPVYYYIWIEQQTNMTKHNQMYQFDEDDIIKFDCQCDIRSESCVRCQAKGQDQFIFTGWVKRMQLLNPQLNMIKIPLFDPSNESFTLTLQHCYLVILKLLEFRSLIVSTRNKDQDDIARLKSDIEACRKANETLKEEIQAKTKMIGEKENQMNFVKNKYEKIIAQQTLEKEEVLKQLFKVQQFVTQHAVEMKKKEQEISKLREHLKKAINDKSIKYENRFEVQVKIDEQIEEDKVYYNMIGWEQWAKDRKFLLDENYELRNTLEEVGKMNQHFIQDVYGFLQINYDPFNMELIQQPHGERQFIDHFSQHLKKCSILFGIIKNKNEDIDYEFVKQEYQTVVERKKQESIHQEMMAGNIRLSELVYFDQISSTARKQLSHQKQLSSTKQLLKQTVQKAKPKDSTNRSLRTDTSFASNVSLSDIKNIPGVSQTPKSKPKLQKW